MVSNPKILHLDNGLILDGTNAEPGAFISISEGEPYYKVGVTATQEINKAIMSLNMELSPAAVKISEYAMRVIKQRFFTFDGENWHLTEGEMLADLTPKQEETLEQVIPAKAKLSRKVLVYGGRDYGDQEYVDIVLNTVHAKINISRIIHGCCTGVDTLADNWARKMHILVGRFPITPKQWREHGKRAAYMRNVEMAKQEPILCVQFPGGKGTKLMRSIAYLKNIPVFDA